MFISLMFFGWLIHVRVQPENTCNVLGLGMGADLESIGILLCLCPRIVLTKSSASKSESHQNLKIGLGAYRIRHLALNTFVQTWVPNHEYYVELDHELWATLGLCHSCYARVDLTPVWLSLRLHWTRLNLGLIWSILRDCFDSTRSSLG